MISPFRLQQILEHLPFILATGQAPHLSWTRVAEAVLIAALTSASGYLIMIPRIEERLVALQREIVRLDQHHEREQSRVESKLDSHLGQHAQGMGASSNGRAGNGPGPADRR